jgi:hypothetical protein
MQKRWCIYWCLNMFRSSSCPSSGEQYKDHNAYGVQHWPCCSRLEEKRWFGVHLLGLPIIMHDIIMPIIRRTVQSPQRLWCTALLRAYTITYTLTHPLNQPHSNLPPPPRPTTHTNPLHALCYTLINTDIKAIYTRNSQCYTGLFYSAVHHRRRLCTILLMMGMMMPETRWDTNKYIIFSASGWLSIHLHDSRCTVTWN